MFVPKDILQAQIDITNNCNLNCKHCRANIKSPIYNESNNINYLEFKNIIKELSICNISRLTISGGEPFLHPEIIKIIKLVKDIPSIKYIGITSNGLLLNNEYINKLKPYKNILNIQISIDGFAKFHDKQRGIKGAFNITLKHINNLINNGFKISINITINKDNIDSIDKLINFLYKNGIKQIGFRHEIPSGKSKFIGDYSFLSKYFLILSKYFTYNLKNKIRFTCGDPKRVLVDSKILSKYSINDIIDGKIIGGCSIGLATIYINHKGELNLCPYLNYKVSNNTNNLKYKWENSITINKFREFNNLKGKCGKCRWKYVCGGCRAVSKQTCKNSLSNDSFCLFGNSDYDIFKNYLLNSNIKNKIIDISETNKNDYIYIPYWGQLFLNINETTFNNTINSSWVKRDIKEIHKKNYNYIISDKENDLKYFYHKMYLPYTLSRNTINSIILMPYFFIKHIFNKNGKIIFITNNNERIGGYLFSEKEPGYIIATTMGINLDSIKEKNNFISSALYYFLMKWSLNNNINILSYGKTRLFKNDGILKFKQKWGAKNYEIQNGGLYVKFSENINISDYFLT